MKNDARRSMNRTLLDNNDGEKVLSLSLSLNETTIRERIAKVTVREPFGHEIDSLWRETIGDRHAVFPDRV